MALKWNGYEEKNSKKKNIMYANDDNSCGLTAPFLVLTKLNWRSLTKIIKKYVGLFMNGEMKAGYFALFLMYSTDFDNTTIIILPIPSYYLT
jgi:hypothetical protein